MRAVILALMLAGCASHNMRDTYAHGDIDRDGCIAYRCQMWCKADATPEQIAAFKAGVIDAGERKQLRRLGVWIAGDTATTIAALSVCAAAKEANPWLGPDPSAVAVVIIGGISYAIIRDGAAKSPEWCSSERQIRIAAHIRTAVSISNAAIAVVCP